MWKRVQHLQRGINTSEWLAQSSDYNPARLRSYTTLENIDRIAGMGFDHIRISIDPAVFCYKFPWNDCERVQVLDEVVARALSRDLAVIVDLHPTSDFKRDIASRDDAVERLTLFWSRCSNTISAAGTNNG